MTWPTFTFQIAPAWSPLDASPTWRTLTRSDGNQYLTDFRVRRGKSAESDTAQAGTASFTLDDGDDRVFDPFNTSSKWYITYLNLTGASGSYASSPDQAAYDIVGDIDIRCRIYGDITPAAASALVSKWVNTSNLSYMLILNTDGTLYLYWTTGGTGATVKSATSTVSLSTVTTDNTKVHLRATLDVDNGAAGNTVTFYYSTQDRDRHSDVTWTQLGAAVTTAGVTSIFSGTAPLAVGAQTNGTAAQYTGRIYYAAVLSGIGGTVVANPDFTLGIGAGVSSFTDDIGRAWTVSSPAAITSDTARGSWLRPRLPVRLRATLNATTYNVFRGHVVGIDQQYTPNTKRQVTLSCSDLFTVMATVDVSDRSAWAATLAAIGPRAWWRLGETTMTPNVTAVTSENGRYDGFYSGTTPTPSTSLVDSDTSGSLGTGTLGYAVLPAWGSGISSTDHNLIVCRFQTSATAARTTIWSIKWVYPDPAGDISYVLTLYVNAAGTVCLELSNAGVALGTLFSTNSGYNNGAAHTVAYWQSGIVGSGVFYVDGSDVSTSSGTTFLTPQYVTNMWVGVQADGTNGAVNTTIDEVAIVSGTIANTNYTIGTALISDLHTAAAASWSGESTGTRIGRAAKLAFVPSALVSLDTGNSTVGKWTTGGSALDLAQKSVTTEQGLLFVEGDGTLTFKQRSNLRNLSTSYTLSDTGGGVTYAGHDGDVAEQRIVNRARFTSTAGEGTYQDDDSIRMYGIHDTDRTTLDDTVANLKGGAQYVVQRWKDGDARITELTVDPEFDGDTAWAMVLSPLIGKQITFNRTFSVGAALSDQFVVTGLEHQVTPTTWRTVLQVTTGDTNTYFALDAAGRGLDSGALIAAF